MPKSFERGQLVAMKHNDPQWKKRWYVGVVVRIYSNRAMVYLFDQCGIHPITPCLEELVPAQEIFKWMKKCNARIM